MILLKAGRERSLKNSAPLLDISTPCARIKWPTWPPSVPFLLASFPSTRELPLDERVIFPPLLWTFTEDVVLLTHLFVRIVPLSDTTRLYQVNQKQIAGILSGDSLRSLTQELISSLTPPECILLVASYLCSHNPSKFDLRLFGSTKGRRRARLYNQKTQAGQRTKVSLRALRSAGRAFSLDRLLAIAFFLVPEPVPSLHALYQAITGLVERRLLVRVTLRQLLDTPKYRCILPIDTISMLARSVSLDIDRYMMSTY